MDGDVCFLVTIVGVENQSNIEGHALVLGEAEGRLGDSELCGIRRGDGTCQGASTDVVDGVRHCLWLSLHLVAKVSIGGGSDSHLWRILVEGKATDAI